VGSQGDIGRYGDLAAVVFTENNHTAQNFTTDRRRLIEAIEKSAMVQSPGGFARPDSGALPVLTGDQAKRLDDPMGILHGSCSCGLCSIEALSRVSDALVSMPQQRKTGATAVGPIEALRSE
jgi:hypothetical protein